MTRSFPAHSGSLPLSAPSTLSTTLLRFSLKCKNCSFGVSVERWLLLKSLTTVTVQLKSLRRKVESSLGKPRWHSRNVEQNVIVFKLRQAHTHSNRKICDPPLHFSFFPFCFSLNFCRCSLRHLFLRYEGSLVFTTCLTSFWSDHRHWTSTTFQAR